MSLRAFKPFAFMFSFLLLSFGCKKPAPNPELLDPIYAEILKEGADAKKRLEEEKVVLEGHLETLKKVVPQSGQIKYATKRVNESKALVERLRQRAEFYEYHAKYRLKEARKNYLRAFNQSKPWPDPSEISEYQKVRSERLKKRQWSQGDRVGEYNAWLKKNRSVATTEKPK
jgi:hypothetical protein